MKGWIVLHRQFAEWEWYDDINVKVLFIHLLLRANHKNNNWRGKKIKRGQLFTSYSHLSQETGLSVKQVRNALEKLTSTSEVTHEGTNHGTMITVCNYDDYQDVEEEEGKPLDTPMDKQGAREGHERGTRGATNNNENNENNILERGEKEKLKNRVEKKDQDTAGRKKLPTPKKGIEERKKDFKNKIWEKVRDNPKYNQKIVMLGEFSDYWTEHGDNDKKMRFEKEKVFDITRRLAMWEKRESSFKQTNSIRQTNFCNHDNSKKYEEF